MIRFWTLLVVLAVGIAFSGVTFASTLDLVSGKSVLQGTHPKDSDDKKDGDDKKGGDKGE